MLNSRIFQVISGDLWAGAENQCYQLCAQLQKTGVTVHPVLFNDGELAQKLKILGLQVLIWDERTVSTLQMIKKAKQLITDSPPAIVHTHGHKEAIIFGFAKALTKSNVKVIRTIHGGQEYRIAVFDLRRQAIKRLNELVNAYMVDRIIAVSPELQRSLITARNSGKIATIVNAIDCNVLKNNKRSSETHRYPLSPLRLAMFARLVKVKRHDLAIRALALVNRCAVENVNSVELHVFGDGPLNQPLEELCLSLRLNDHVTFHGFVNTPTDAMRSIDAIIMPSDHEGTPMALLEAMALGVPVIGHSVGGIKDILSFTGHGVLVENHSAKGYADAIVKLGTLLPSLGKSKDLAVKKFSQKYDIGNMCLQYIGQYEQLLSTKIS